MLGRNEAHSVDVLEAGCYQFFKVCDLGVGGNEVWQPLPGVARAFDEFKVFGHPSYLALKPSKKAKTGRTKPCPVCQVHRPSCSTGYCGRAPFQVARAG